MVLEDMIVRGLRATEKMTWLDAYVGKDFEHGAGSGKHASCFLVHDNSNKRFSASIPVIISSRQP
jgi:hypothetical protein